MENQLNSDVTDNGTQTRGNCSSEQVRQCHTNSNIGSPDGKRERRIVFVHLSLRMFTTAYKFDRVLRKKDSFVITTQDVGQRINKYHFVASPCKNFSLLNLLHNHWSLSFALHGKRWGKLVSFQRKHVSS